MNKPIEYRIDCLSDFAKVPPKKRELCFQEFLAGLAVAEYHAAEMQRRLREMYFPRWLEWLRLRALKKVQYSVIMEGFTWIDDGEFSAEVKIATGRGRKTIYSSTDWTTGRFKTGA